MKKLFLLCNAHLDPVWQWEWEEGAAAALSTFRTAADFCEQYEGFVFCHNESLLYQWSEEYDPPLFERIQALVAAGKWNIMGGWFLQPDCNMPCGESILRQIITGRQYFREKFGVEPEVAVSFDAFGHNRGLVQILRRCGYTGYLFMRPEADKLRLPARNFWWKGLDGSEILTHRLDRLYLTLKGHATEEAENWLQSEAEEPISLFTWGVGNHGGGPSRVDLTGLNRLTAQETKTAIVHSTAEEFFDALKSEKTEYPHFANDLQPMDVGCYTSQARVKEKHRRLEGELYALEKLLVAASSEGLLEYPFDELADAARDLLLSEFHDILPGSSVQPVEEAAIRMLDHGLEILSRLRVRGLMAMMSGQRKAKEGEIPLFVYNPYPYPIVQTISCEFMPADQNWSCTERNIITVCAGGRVIPSQEEKENSNLNLDWRKHVVFRAELAPFGISRFDCTLHKETISEPQTPIADGAPIRFETAEISVEINSTTGLIDRYCAGGTEFLERGALATAVFCDTPDPWYMRDNSFRNTAGCFRLMTPCESAQFSGVSADQLAPVRIIEDGPVRMVVEAVFCWQSSSLVQTYRLPREGTEIELEQRVYWNEKDQMVKLEIPTLLPEADYFGQCMFGSEPLAQDGTECVSQEWCGLFGKENALTVINTGNYGSHCHDGTVYLSLLRSPAYCANPIEDRPLLRQDRFLPRMDQGEHIFHFYFQGGDACSRRRKIDAEAQQRNAAPCALNIFPSGEGKKIGSFLVLSNSGILLSALYRDKATGKRIARMWNPEPSEQSTMVYVPSMKLQGEVNFSPFAFRTFWLDAPAGITEIDPVKLQPIQK